MVASKKISCEQGHSKSRDRIYTASNTFWLFLYQILAGNLSLEMAVQKAILWLNGLEKYISPNTGAYSKARKRLSTSFLQEIYQHTVNQFKQPTQFHGLNLKVVDGTGISMQDTANLQETFPQHPKAKKTSGFPIFKLVALFDLTTGLLIEWAIDTITTSDSFLYRHIWPYLQPNDLVLGDRHFCGYAYFVFLLKLNVHSLTRKHQGRKHQTIVKKLGKDDLIVEWNKPKQPPKWLNKEEWRKFPDKLRVREVTYTIKYKGFRTSKISIVTTDLRENILACELAELYYIRWKVELNFRDIKTTMGMEILRSKTVEIAEKEFLLFLISYNLIRLLMGEAANKNNISLDKISFKACVNTISIWSHVLAMAKNEKEYDYIFEKILKIIAYPRCRNKRNRSEPRAIKRRPKNYQFLMGNRHEFTPIAHRSKYTKELK